MIWRQLQCAIDKAGVARHHWIPAPMARHQWQPAPVATSTNVNQHKCQPSRCQWKLPVWHSWQQPASSSNSNQPAAATTMAAINMHFLHMATRRSRFEILVTSESEMAGNDDDLPLSLERAVQPIAPSRQSASSAIELWPPGKGRSTGSTYTEKQK